MWWQVACKVLALNQHVVLSVEQAIEQDIMQNANFVALTHKPRDDTCCCCRTQSDIVLDFRQGFQRVYGHIRCKSRVYFRFGRLPLYYR